MFVKYGITGNAMIDSLILANIVPMIMSYITASTNLITKIFHTIWNIIVGWFQSMIKTRVIGNKLCVVMVNRNNQLFDFLQENVFTERVVSDRLENGSKLLSVLTFLKNMGSHDQNNVNANFKRWKRKCENCMNMYVRYDGEGNDILEYEMLVPHYFSRSEKKFFNYKGKVIVVTKKITKEEDKESFKIELLDFSTTTTTVDKNHNATFIEDFLKSRFGLQDKIYYVYSVFVTNDNLTKMIKNLIQNGMKNTGQALLKYGDNNISKSNAINTEVNTISNSITSRVKVDCSCTILNSTTQDYKNFISIDNIADKRIGNETFSYYYKKYISIHGSNGSNFGYFYFENKLYFLTYANSTSAEINIVSFGKNMNKKDIIEMMDWLIQLNIKSDTVRVNNSYKENVQINKLSGTKWTGYGLDKRSFDTIYLPSETLKGIRKEFDTFIEKEKLYREYQIPYKKGILFYGPPGTGKTSLVKSLAYEYQLNIYIININDDSVNDDSIIDILNSIGNNNNKILLFEDVDSAFADKEQLAVQSKITDSQMEKTESVIENTKDKTNKTDKTDKTEGQNSRYDNDMEYNSNKNINQTRTKFLTYSGLLNALDGVLSNQNGVITIMTTNHLHKLGDAFLRPGRIDRMFELKECNSEQIELMLRTFINKRANVFKNIDEVVIDTATIDRNIKTFVEKLVNSEGNSTIKPCELQYYILKHIDNIEDIFKNYNELSCFR